MNYWIAPSFDINIITEETRIEHLILKVCEDYDITLTDFNSTTRKRNVVEARFIVMYILRKVFRITSTGIGKLFNKNHATVLHGVKSIAGYMEFDLRFRHKINMLIGFAKYNY